MTRPASSTFPLPLWSTPPPHERMLLPSSIEGDERNPKKKHRPLSPEMREAGRMCDKYSACARLMAREHLRTDADVKTFISDSERKMDDLSATRNKIRNKLRRTSEPDQIEQLKAERDELTAKISKLRKDIRTADFTLERSTQVRDDIKTELEHCRGDHIKTLRKDHRDREER